MLVASMVSSNTHRPHYHIILFGLGLDDFNFNRLGDPEHRFDIVGSRIQLQGVNELGQNYFRCDWLSYDVWQNGFVCLSEVSWKTCAYVARYVKKKDYGLVQDAFNFHLIEPEYSVMSRNPGIGMFYPEDHKDCFDYNVKYFSDQDGVTKVRMPSALLKYLYVNDRVKYNELKNERQKYSHDLELTKLMQTDLSSMEMMNISEYQINKNVDVLDYYRSL